MTKLSSRPIEGELLPKHQFCFRSDENNKNETFIRISFFDSFVANCMKWQLKLNLQLESVMLNLSILRE